MRRDGMCRRFRRIHDPDVRRSDSMQQRLQQGIMSTAQHQHVGILKPATESLAEVNARDLLGDAVVNPAFLQQRPRFLPRVEAARLQSPLVGVTAYGSFGSNDNDFPVLSGRSGSLSSRFN